jgi:hypothetical protein
MRSKCFAQLALLMGRLKLSARIVLFRDTDLQVINLRTVFEYRAAMMPIALEAFIQEYRLTFPIGGDQAGVDTPIPVTMAHFGMRGTPTTILFGRDGAIRHHGFGKRGRHGSRRADRFSAR